MGLQPAAREGIVVVNAGSSSLKFELFTVGATARPETAVRGEIEGLDATPCFVARDARATTLEERRWPAGTGLHELLDWLVQWIEGHLSALGAGRLRAAGHRVATGGLAPGEPVRVDAEVLARLRALVPLAPLHQPRNLAPIEALARLHPGLPQVACFDTAFHRTMPETASLYGLPRTWLERGARRYGYHGLSYEFIAGELPHLDVRAAGGRTIVAHLGSGASLCALRAGRSVATTMGFSPLSGLVMATRPGDLDPGLLLWLLRQPGMDLDRLESVLYRDSGLAGVSGLGGDMRTLLASDAAPARQAVDLFVHRICREIGALCSELNGLDALVFTAGIGENAPAIRAAVCHRLGWLGVTLDDVANAGCPGPAAPSGRARGSPRHGGTRVSRHDSTVSVWVIPTDEEMTIARHVVRLVGQAADVATAAATPPVSSTPP